jgi:hypothetical protein
MFQNIVGDCRVHSDEQYKSSSTMVSSKIVSSLDWKHMSLFGCFIWITTCHCQQAVRILYLWWLVISGTSLIRKQKDNRVFNNGSHPFSSSPGCRRWAATLAGGRLGGEDVAQLLVVYCSMDKRKMRWRCL